ncbi:hypothetical protein [Thalassospira sp.]|uniref:hypothetical protein n=1 Tax=Thalassospira sp. TaxID=1912094 RepID=UPI0027345A5A|nr:hypothetical protein [Thalassospira sp.]MDP2696893.1 hypothetical protein [Thalassospira sp.]
MKLSKKFMITGAILAAALATAPIGSAFADGPGKNRGDCSFYDKDGMPGGMRGDMRGGKHPGHWGMGNQGMMRETALTTDEVRLLVEAMILRSGTENVKIGSITPDDDGEEITVTLQNEAGAVITELEIDAFSGRPDRGDMRKAFGKPDRTDRLNRSFDAAQMETLTKAMVLRHGKGELVLGSLTETDRGTFVATITNKAGDLVREVELSRVTGMPVS